MVVLFPKDGFTSLIFLPHSWTGKSLSEVKHMKTEHNKRRIRVRLEREAQEPIDPEALWLNEDIEPEELIRLDPLDITPEMETQAERPELADPFIAGLPYIRFSIRRENAFLKLVKVWCRPSQGRPETALELLTRLRASP
jgi:hypothetical protein